MTRIKKILAIASVAAAAHLSGRLAENYDHRMGSTLIKSEVIESAAAGYTWKESSEPKFSQYHTKLIIHDDMTMAGYLVDSSDGSIIGMVRKGGYVGTNLAERAQRWGENIVEEGKEQAGHLGEKTQELYNTIKKETKDFVK